MTGSKYTFQFPGTYNKLLFRKFINFILLQQNVLNPRSESVQVSKILKAMKNRLTSNKSSPARFH